MLDKAPDAVLDADGKPRFGSFRGAVPKVELHRAMPSRIMRLFKQKRWQWAMVATDEVVASYAIVDVGYASNAWIVVGDRKAGTLLAHKGFLGLPGLVSVDARPADGARARFRGPGVKMGFERHDGRCVATVKAGGIELDAVLDANAAPEPLTCIAPVAGGLVNVTMKIGAMPTLGSLTVDGRRFDLGGGFGGLDYTCGLLARETAWRWAFAVGRDTKGEPVCFNLAEGFNAGEDAVWRGRDVGLLPPCHFTFDGARTQEPWAIRSEDGTVDLTFRAWGEHREDRNLGVAKAHFVQVMGEFTGRVGEVEVAGLAGVTEDQAVRW